MRISASNQLEVLVSQLADSLQNEKCRPEELLGRPNDLVIIQSRGMAKWIDMQVADHNSHLRDLIGKRFRFRDAKDLIDKC